jgi:hypothetical protein
MSVSASVAEFASNTAASASRQGWRVPRTWRFRRVQSQTAREVSVLGPDRAQQRPWPSEVVMRPSSGLTAPAMYWNL